MLKKTIMKITFGPCKAKTRNNANIVKKVQLNANNEYGKI